MCQPIETPRPGQALSRRDATAVLLGTLAGGVGACARSRGVRGRSGARGRTVFTPTSSRLDLVPGVPMLMPVRVEGTLPGSVAPRLILSDGRGLDASLLWIGVQLQPPAMAGWLPSVEQWVVTPASEGAIPESTGAWHVVAELPEDAGGQAIRLGDGAVRVNWLATPGELRPGTVAPGEVWAPWRRPPGSRPPSPDLLAPEWRSPLRRWRARLVTTGLDTPAPIEGIWPVLGERRALDAMADLVEARWRVGLARLWYADAPACARLLARLTNTVALAPGVEAPAWPTEQASLDLLLADLLDPARSGDSLVARSEAWMRSLPAAAGWVADDAAGVESESGEALVALRAATLTGEPALLWLEGQRGARVGDPHPLEPGTAAELRAEADRGDAERGGSRFVIHCGEADIAVHARMPDRIVPPGARCGPLLHDWTLDSWGASDEQRGAVPERAWVTAAMIYRDDSGVSASGWSLYVECARGSARGEDAVRVWFGAREDSPVVLRISSDGTVRDERRPGEEVLLGVSQEEGRWSIGVPLPREAVERGGIMRLGLVRRDARGVRTAWPRRLMPWEEEPARAAIDTRGWSGLEPS